MTNTYDSCITIYYIYVASFDVCNYILTFENYVQSVFLCLPTSVLIAIISTTYIERGRMRDSQSRQPGFKSPLLPFQRLGIFVFSTMPQFTRLYK